MLSYTITHHHCTDREPICEWLRHGDEIGVCVRWKSGVGPEVGASEETALEAKLEGSLST